MDSEVPKQFMDLNGLPVIMHAIRAFTSFSPDINIILVLPEDDTDEWDHILKMYPLDIEFNLCTGGETRFDSVKNGLELVEGNGLVAIHDAVRPLISKKLIADCFLAASTEGNAIPVIPVQDSMRELSGEHCRPARREAFRLVQTPQVFDIALIKKAYEQGYRSSFTDDATVAEALGARINLVEGEKKNIKITTREDLLIAKALL
jgi:2-C-methyl-D-erythritol 4-phosphate cytidylyltransferase